MEVIYRSTRSNGAPVTASQAILKGLSDDGGLFVPDHIPTLDKSLKELAGMTYQQVAYEVMKLFLTDFTEEELKSCINKAYDDKFDTEVIAPLTEAGNAYYLELYHGATIAFKDMALSILPHLLTTSAKKNHAYIGRIERVLVDGTSRSKEGTYEGRTDSFKLVNFTGEAGLEGKIVPVKITGANTFSLTGETADSLKL